MSKSYTVTLNDNVVSKLQAIVGGGSGNSLVTKADIAQAIAEGSHFNVDNFITFVQSKSDNYATMTSINIQGIIAVRDGYGANIFSSDSVSYSGSIQDTLSNEKLAIEEIAFPSSESYDVTNNFITVDNSGPSSTGEYSYALSSDYVLLVLVCGLSNEDTECYPITLDDVLTFIDAPSN